MSNEELSKYTNQIKNPSETFKLFLYHYVTGSTWIRSRGEEDITVWEKLEGDELEIAKQIILDELKTVPDVSYIRAVGFFKDKRAIPILEHLINTYPQKFIAEKMHATKVLFNWIGYVDYVSILEKACRSRDSIIQNYFKYAIDQFTDGLEEADKERIMKALNGANS